ncbi:hypothetical protein MTR67_043755, partial [Solanum verrucosum]
GLRNKVRTLTGRKEKNKLKPPKVPVCQALKERTKLVIKRNSWWITELFREANIDRPKLQTLRMLRTKAKGR